MPEPKGPTKHKVIVNITQQGKRSRVDLVVDAGRFMDAHVDSNTTNKDGARAFRDAITAAIAPNPVGSYFTVEGSAAVDAVQDALHGALVSLRAIRDQPPQPAAEPNPKPSKA